MDNKSNYYEINSSQLLEVNTLPITDSQSIWGFWLELKFNHQDKVVNTTINGLFATDLLSILELKIRFDHNGNNTEHHRQ